MARVTVIGSLYNRFKLYANIYNRKPTDVVAEALEFWMDTIGAADIYKATGVETGPQYPTEAEQEQDNLVSIESVPAPTRRVSVAIN